MIGFIINIRNICTTKTSTEIPIFIVSKLFYISKTAGGTFDLHRKFTQYTYMNSHVSDISASYKINMHV